MEEEKRKNEFEKRDNEIVYSRSIKAGRRIYYLDVKKSRNDDLFIAITESKKKVYGSDQNAQVSFEKHKIFLYKEDFNMFTEALNDVVEFIKNEKGDFMTREEYIQQKEKDSESIVAATEISSTEETELQKTEEGEGEDDNENKKGFFKFKF